MTTDPTSASPMSAQYPGLAMGGLTIFDSNTPGVIGPTVVNGYTTLGIPPYWRAMNFIANNMAAFPRFVSKGGTPKRHALDAMLKRRPNTYQSGTTFWRTLFFHRAHYGNGFAAIERDGQFNPVALHGHVPELVAPFWFYDDDGNRVAYYYVGGVNPRFVAAADMLHLSGLSYNGVDGMNPVIMLSEAFERSRTVDRYMTRFLTRGTVIKGAIQIPGTMDETQLATMVARVRKQFSGPSAERDLMILTDGATLNNATLSAADAQLVQQAAYTTKQVAQITGVPPVFLFDQSEAKYNNTTEQAFDMVVRDLFRPLIEEVEDELSLKLLPDPQRALGWGVRLDPDALIRGDTATTSAVAVAQKNAGIRTPNEARAMVGLPPAKGGAADDLTTLGGTGAPPAPPTKNAADPAPPTDDDADQ